MHKMNSISFINLILFFGFILVQIKTISSDANTPIVTTKLGQIKGTVRTLDDRNTSVNLFHGIRYGKSPVGHLRFRKPEPESKWDGVYDATKVRNACPQILGMIPAEAPVAEDCLFLSVWQPTKPLENGKKRSVMFFIHGGGFDSGTEFTVAYDSRWLAALGDVIVVTINYRLGPFGFLYADNEEAPGNVGLYDQIMALDWVKQNIDAFGGDSNSITIFGESAGSMSVGALLVSPLTKGLFKRAIMESGSPDSLIGSDSKEVQMTKFRSLSDKLGCNQTIITESISCLRNKSVSDILDVSSNGIANAEVFNPVYGDQLMPIKPFEALKTGKYNQNIELLFGTVRDEGSLFVEELFPDFSPEKHINLTVSLAKQYIQLIFTVLKQNYSQSVADLYTNGLKDNQSTELLTAVSNSLGDYVLTCPTILFGAEFVKFNKSNKAYAYKLTHKPGISAFPLCLGWMGVCHADDIVFIFGFPIGLRGVSFTENDYKLSKDMIHVWSTFAKEGSPPAIDGVKWPEAIDVNVSDPSVKYMQLNPTNYTVVENGYKAGCEGFWRQHLT